MRKYSYILKNLECAHCAQKIETEIAKEKDFKNVCVNSGDTENSKNYIHQIAFDDIYNDGTATGKGVINNIIVQK